MSKRVEESVEASVEERSVERPPHRVLILGGGFAGVMTAQELERRLGRRRDVEIWLVNRDNFFLFTPLLPEATSGVLEPRHVVNPLRGMVRDTWCITAEVETIDLDGGVVTVLGGDGDLHRLHYDTLVLALGGVTRTFGITGLAEQAAGMRTLADSFALRNRIIEMLERAELEDEPAQRRAQLTFVVGGAGFSGVETVGEIEEFVRRVRARWYSRIPEDAISFYLVEMRDRVLPEMGGAVSRYAARALRRRGIRILLNTPIREVREAEVVVGDRRIIPSRTLVWTGGIGPSPLVAETGVAVDRAGRAVTDGCMETSRPGVFALGDSAAIPDPASREGKPYPATAQHAVREAARLAENIVARIDGRPMRPFRYRTIGTLASLGHRTGVGVVFGVRVTGLLAWLMWRGYYWWRLPGLNRKLRVLLDWGLTSLFGADPVQLKVEPEESQLGASGKRRPRGSPAA
jgi:NADH dehydrogenase